MLKNCHENEKVPPEQIEVECQKNSQELNIRPQMRVERLNIDSTQRTSKLVVDFCLCEAIQLSFDLCNVWTYVPAVFLK
jgi:hypothetical protein